jgi:hypothetical protein
VFWFSTLFYTLVLLRSISSPTVALAVVFYRLPLATARRLRLGSFAIPLCGGQPPATPPSQLSGVELRKSGAKPRPKLQKRAQPATESPRQLASRRVFEQALTLPPLRGQNHAVHGDPRKRGFGGRTLSKPDKRKRRFAQRPRTDALPKHTVCAAHLRCATPRPETRNRTLRVVGQTPVTPPNHCGDLRSMGFLNRL